MEFPGAKWIGAPQAAAAEGAWEGLVLVAVLALVAALAWRASRGRPSRSRRTGWPSKLRAGAVVPFDRGTVRDPAGKDRIDLAAEQMRAVGLSDYERVPLLNKEEARLLPILERVAREANRGHRVMAQVSLGEVIRPRGRDNADAYSAIGSKRLDFAIIDSRGLIACAIEYQGTGHYQNHAAFRDAVKREALRKAGVRLVEVMPDFREPMLAQTIREAIAPERAEHDRRG